MHRNLPILAIAAAVGLLSGAAAAEARKVPKPPKPPARKVDPERRLDQLRGQLERLVRQRDELIKEKKLKDNDPRVRRLDEQIERIEREIHALSGRVERPERHPPEGDRQREMDRLHERLGQLERQRDELIDKKKLKEDDPRVREATEQMERIERELDELGRHRPRSERDVPGPREPFVIGARHGAPKPPSPELIKRLEAILPEIAFEEDPFEEVIEFLRERGRINLHVDWRSLEEIDVDREATVSMEVLKNVPLMTAIKMALRAASPEPGMIGAFVDGDVVVVTTWEGMPQPGARGPSVEDVLERLRHDRPEVHERLMDLRRENPERFQAELDEIMHDVPGPREPLVIGARHGMPNPPSPELAERLEAILPEIAFEEDPFEEVIEFLRERGKINLHVDWRSLEEIDVDREATVNMEVLKNVPLMTAIKMALRAASPEPGMIGAFVDGDVVVVTTWEGMPQPGGRGPSVEDVLERLRHERPEVHERLMNLRREDPERFQAELAEIMRDVDRPPPREGEEMEGREAEAHKREELDRADPERRRLMARDEELARRTDELADQIRRAKQPDAREKLAAQLRELLNAHFDVRMQIRRREVEELQRHLHELTTGLERRIKSKPELIERRMKALLNPEESIW